MEEKDIHEAQENNTKLRSRTPPATRVNTMSLYCAKHNKRMTSHKEIRFCILIKSNSEVEVPIVFVDFLAIMYRKKVNIHTTCQLL
jgi:hypothetical protein